MRAGSLQNMLYDGATNEVEAEVGMGGTYVMWTDRKAVTVVEVSRTGHRVVTQDDTATRVDSNGMSDAQRYEFSRDENGTLRTFTRRKDGAYRETGGTSRLLLGARQHYYDYSF